MRSFAATTRRRSDISTLDSGVLLVERVTHRLSRQGWSTTRLVDPIRTRVLATAVSDIAWELGHGRVINVLEGRPNPLRQQIAVPRRNERIALNDVHAHQTDRDRSAHLLASAYKIAGYGNNGRLGVIARRIIAFTRVDNPPGSLNFN